MTDISIFLTNLIRMNQLSFGDANINLEELITAKDVWTTLENNLVRMVENNFVRKITGKTAGCFPFVMLC